MTNKDLSNWVANLEDVSYDLEQDGDSDCVTGSKFERAKRRHKGYAWC